MKKILYRSIIFLVHLGLVLNVMGQDPNYSQWLNAPLYYNPAYAGLNTGLRARFSARDQWPNLQQDFRTYYFSADYGDRKLPGSGGIGLLINKDNEGVSFIKDLSVGLALSVRIPIASNVIAQVGIKGVLVQKWLMWNNLVFSDQLNAKYGNIYAASVTSQGDDKRLFPDFGIGGIVQFVNGEGNLSGTAGFAADHIFQPDESFLSIAKSPLPRKYVAHLDFIISMGSGPSSSQNPVRGFGDALKLNPGIIFQNQHGMNSFQIGVNALKYNFYLGGYFKTSSAIAPATTSLMLLAGYRYMLAGDINLKFMYSYDIQVSRNLQGTGGAHEISLIIEFKGIRMGGKAQYEACPAINDVERRGSSFECSPF
jgi:type IX secretion system PorP/SprF family membrane protein